MRKHLQFVPAALCVALLFSGCTENPEKNPPTLETDSGLSPMITPGTPTPDSGASHLTGTWEECDNTPFTAPSPGTGIEVSETYQGKTQSEYELEATQSSLVWCEQISLSPTGRYAVFNSNRNCLDSQGMSVFLLDCDTKVETLLVDGTNGFYNTVLGWWLSDDSFVLISNKDDVQEYSVCSISGEVRKIDLEQAYYTIIDFREDAFLFYLGADANTVSYARLQTDGSTLDMRSYTPEHGYLMGEGTIGPDLETVALKVRESYDSFERSIFLWNVSTGQSSSLPNPVVAGASDIAAIFLAWPGEYLNVYFSMTVSGTERSAAYQWVN